MFSGRGYFTPARDAFHWTDEPASWWDTQKDCRLGEHSLVIWGDGDTVEVDARADAGPVRFLLVSGRPLHKPIAWFGAIVMDTQDELRQAFEE